MRISAWSSDVCSSDLHVIVEQNERQQLVENKAKEAAAAAGLILREDQGMVTETAGLTEWPVPLLGHFDPVFLEVPPEVIQLTMRTNQKYFPVPDAPGKLEIGRAWSREGMMKTVNNTGVG